MSNDTAKTITTNIVPVQGIFQPAPTFALVSLIGPAGTPFYPTIDPSQSGLNITNSTINSTTIGLTSPAAGAFTTATVSTSPTAPTDVANKQYVDYYAAGLSWKEPVEAATMGNITLSGEQTVDTVAVVAGDRVLVKNQNNAEENGIYTVAVGAWSRSIGADDWNEYLGAIVFVVEGSQSGSAWYCTAQPGGTLGVTPLNWSNFSVSSTYTAGTGLTLSGTQFSITNTGVSAATYGSASTVPVFAVNAQGQLTSVTNTTIAIAHTQVSGLGSMATQNANNVAITGGTISGVSISGYAQSGANTDITSLSGLTGGISTPNHITFDTTPSTTPTADGSLYWDNADSIQTLSLVMANGDAVQQIGEEQYYRIKASSAITNGQVVMFTGSVGASGGLTGAPATGLSASTAYAVMGIATHSIALNGWGYVTAFGLVRNIDTTGSSVGETWADGDILYYNPSVTGGLTKTIPSAPNAKVQVCAVVHAASNGSLFVRPTFGGALGQYEGDVSISTPSNGQLLIRNQTAGTWVNASLGTGSGISTTVGAGTLSISNTGVLSIAGTANQITASASTGAITLSLPATINVDTSGNAATATSATSATTATNLAGGASGSLPYQSASGTTAMLGIGSTGQVLKVVGGLPAWSSDSSGVTISDDTTTNATRYLTFVDVTTGNATTEYVASTKLSFNPSTGVLSSSAFVPSGSTAPTNGLYLPTTNTLALSTASTERMRIDSSGNVGINGTPTDTGFDTTDTRLYVVAPNSDFGAALTTISDSLGRNIRLANQAKTTTGSIDANSTGISVGSSSNHPLVFNTNNTEKSRISAAGGFSVGTTADPGAGAIYATGNITAYYSSDRSLKENIKDVDGALAIVSAIGSKTFDWTDAYIASKGGEDGYFVQKSDFGVIAQDVQAVFPQAVRTREDGTLAVDYEKLSTLAFGAIKELVKRVEALESK